MTTQALWEKDPPLMQLPHVTREVAKRAEEAGTMPLGVQPASTPNWRQISLILFNSAVAWIRAHACASRSVTVSG